MPVQAQTAITPKDKNKEIKLRSTVPFKLKDREGRNYKAIDLESQFGFLPKQILISKLHGMNNTIVLSAVVPEKTKK